MKKTVIYLMFILMFTVSLSAQHFQITGFAGVNSVFKYGSENDYIAGANDFPVTPSHKTPNLGLSLSYYLTENLGLQLSGIYNFSTKIKLEDPSDGDSVEINSAKNYSFLLELYYEKRIGKITPYISLGGGINKIIGHSETVLSEYGWEIEFLPPERTIDPVFSVGSGIKYNFSDVFGLNIGIKYNLIFSKSNKISNLILFGGLLIGF